MDGRKVLLFTMNYVPQIVRKTLKENKVTLNELKYVIFHQASKYILDNINRRLTITKNETFENYGKVGNTISASIPIALKDAYTNRKISNKNNIIIAGYGVGLSWGSALIKWNKIL